jgi:hypothetical protein
METLSDLITLNEATISNNIKMLESQRPADEWKKTMFDRGVS